MKTRMLKQFALAALTTLCGAAGVVNATPVTIPNFSFESPTLSAGELSAALALMDPNLIRTNEYWYGAGNGGNNIQNITGTTNLFTLTGSGALPPPADGTNFLLMGINTHLGYVWQDVGPVQSNTVYTLTIAYGQLLPNANGAITASGLIALVNGSDPFESYLGSTNIDSSILTPGTFGDATVTVTTGNHVSGDLTILMLGSGGDHLGFDNVRLDATPVTNATALLPTVSPTNQVFQGQAVTLSENAAGKAPFTYQWLSDNGSGGATFTPISGATGTNYVANTSSLTPGSSVEYEVAVQNALGTSNSAPVTITILSPQAPALTADTSPNDGTGNGSSEPVGGSITFSASFSGSVPLGYQWQYQDTGGDSPVAIAGATNATLTLSNLQLSDTGFYYLTATNSLGSASSTERLFNVSTPLQTNALVLSIANQFGFGGLSVFTPSWTIASGSLIAGLEPSSFDTNGTFALAGAGGTPVLTDGKFGDIWPAGTASASLASCGNQEGAGSYLIYTLPAGTTNGINVTNIVVYGGWSDSGRDQQSYNIYYSTTSNPTNYNIFLGNVSYDPTTGNNTPDDQSATRISITGTNAGGVIAYNVAGIKFDFTTPVENGWAGYAEIQIFGEPGTAALLPPLLTQVPYPPYAADVVGGQETFTAGFSGSQIAYQWLVDTGSGPVPVPGATNAVLTLSNLQASEAGNYSLQATNLAGVAVTPSSSTLVVNSAPGPDGNGIDVFDSVQTGVSTLPATWTVAPGSLIAGKLPTTALGQTESDNTSPGLIALTDGQIGSQDSGALTNFEGFGSGLGINLIYTLSGSPGGFNLTNIVVYGGWQDGGRDEQAYTIYYSTVADPTNFLLLDTIDYLPSPQPSNANDTRVSLATDSGAPLATNVYQVWFNFTNPPAENGWEGYAEIQLFGSAAAAIPIPLPALTSDTAPPIGSDVVGSSATFTAAFNSTLPLTYQWQKNGTNVPGATATTLTIKNLQLSDSGSYNLVASTANGSASSTTNTFVVVPAPSPVNGIVESPAIQASVGIGFIPTWPLSNSSLIAGKSPSSVGAGNFAVWAAGGTAALTDGTLQDIQGGIQMFAAAGTGGDNPGQSVTYTLTGSTTGYDLTNITVFGGWQDSGRDQQSYTIYYSTAADPTNFSVLTSVNYLPKVPGTTASFTTANATRVTITTASGEPLATDVALVKFDFTSPSGENGWEGYSELEVFGTPSSVTTTNQTITFNPVQVSAGSLILSGAGGSAGAAYTLLTSTNLTTPLAEWTTNTAGVFTSSGTFSNGIPILNTEPTRFFRLKTP